jgi:hypothetical protein
VAITPYYLILIDPANPRDALRSIDSFPSTVLVVALGLDDAKDNLPGTWSLTADDLRANGRCIDAFGLPTLAVQERGDRLLLAVRGRYRGRISRGKAATRHGERL